MWYADCCVAHGDTMSEVVRFANEKDVLGVQQKLVGFFVGFLGLIVKGHFLISSSSCQYCYCAQMSIAKRFFMHRIRVHVDDSAWQFWSQWVDLQVVKAATMDSGK